MTQRQSQVNLLTIAEFAQICGTTSRTLRFYEQRGLFKPFKIDQWNSYRYYHPSQARDFFRIKLLKNFHLPLSRIRVVIKGKNTEVLLQNKLKSLNREIEEKQKEYQFLQNIDKVLLKEFDLKSRLRAESLGPFNLFCTIIEKGEYIKIGQYIRQLWDQAQKLAINCKTPEIIFYLDHAFNPKETRLELALTCSGKIPKIKNLPKNHYFNKFPKTKVVVYKYTGPFQYLPLIYERFYEYMDQAKIDYKEGGVLEISVRGPKNTKSQYDYITKIGYYL